MDAVVLSGGAAYGAYEVGVLKALSEKKRFDPEIITGTSVGAFNAAILAGDSISRLEEVWREDIPEKGLRGNGVLRIRGNPIPHLASINPMALFAGVLSDTASLTKSAIQRSGAFLTSHGGPSSRLSEFFDVSAFVSCEPLHETIAKTVSLKRIRESRKQLQIIATDWEAGEARIFHNRDMTEADGESIILASAALPGIFPAVMWRGRALVDGGVVMNTPLKPAIQAGADAIHVISVIPPVSKVEPSELDNTFEAMIRVLQIQVGSTIREDAATAGWINAGIEVLKKAKAGDDITPVQLRDFVRVAEQLRKRAEQGSEFRHVTIHHYHPEGSLGSPLGLLDFTRSNIETLINRGFKDASSHICHDCGCILPPECDKSVSARL
jgi:predicted acylesterase/phospholipase RssA